MGVLLNPISKSFDLANLLNQLPNIKPHNIST